MNLTIITLKTFVKDIKRLHNKYKKISDDLKELNQTLKENPKAGVELGRNCFKIRVTNSSTPTGKRGGFRVVYYYHDENSHQLYLMTMYAKNEIENVSDERLLEILKESGIK